MLLHSLSPSVLVPAGIVAAAAAAADNAIAIAMAIAIQAAIDDDCNDDWQRGQNKQLRKCVSEFVCLSVQI